RMELYRWCQLHPAAISGAFQDRIGGLCTRVWPDARQISANFDHQKDRRIKMSASKKAAEPSDTRRPAEGKDPYCHEGAVEQDKPNQTDNTSMAGQMGHRNKPADLDSLDTDFPEPGENPEHSGE